MEYVILSNTPTRASITSFLNLFATYIKLRDLLRENAKPPKKKRKAAAKDKGKGKKGKGKAKASDDGNDENEDNEDEDEENEEQNEGEEGAHKKGITFRSLFSMPPFLSLFPRYSLPYLSFRLPPNSILLFFPSLFHIFFFYSTGAPRVMRAVPVMSMVCVQGIIKLLCGTVLEDDVQQPLLESPTLITFILDACKNQLDLVIHLSSRPRSLSSLRISHFM